MTRARQIARLKDTDVMITQEAEYDEKEVLRPTGKAWFEPTSQAGRDHIQLNYIDAYKQSHYETDKDGNGDWVLRSNIECRRVSQKAWKGRWRDVEDEDCLDFSIDGIVFVRNIARSMCEDGLTLDSDVLPINEPK